MKKQDKRKVMESANRRLLGEEMEPSKTLMYHCDAKSCEHYKEKEGTTNCLLKQISISAVGDCNQFEPKSEKE